MANGKRETTPESAINTSIRQSTRPQKKSRNIILFADGTANSAASASKTNVWRLFEALDLGPDRSTSDDGDLSIRSIDSENYQQLAFYNDGVGTSGWIWWQYLAQGLGLGVSKNVKNLYRQLCRHYQPGDKIYVFGFSRGAYTARVLCDMVSTCGILDRERPAPDLNNTSMETMKGFESGVDAAHRAYRRYYWESSWFGPRMANRAWNFLWEKIGRYRTYYTKPIVENSKGSIPKDRDFFATFSHSLEKMNENNKPKDEIIRFLGVWDTVASHGISIREVADIWDKIYPYNFTDYSVSPHVTQIRHAIALDDERQSFLPVLIDEAEREPDKLKQVWFAGMHADIGGGYPDDNLAHHPLLWMMKETEDKTGKDGLVYNKGAMEEVAAKAQPTGTLHNSRRGIGCFFRYQPRNIGNLSQNPFKPGKQLLKKTVIHQSALDRILDAKAEYAPFGIPKDVEMCDTEGKISKPDSSSKYGILEADSDMRSSLHERARFHVFWRRVCYFGMLIPILLLMFMPFFEPSIPGWFAPLDQNGKYIPHIFLTTIFPYGGSIIPGLGLFSFWTDVWAQSAWWTLSLCAIALFFWGWSFYVQGNVQKLAEAGWWLFKGNKTKSDAFSPGFGESISRFFAYLFHLKSKAKTGFEVIKVLFALVFLIAVISTVAVLATRWLKVPSDISYTLCKITNANLTTEEVRNEKYHIVKSPISNPCIKSTFYVEEGEHYRFFVKTGAHRDADGDEYLRLADPFCSRQRAPAPWYDNSLPGQSQKASNRGLICPLRFFTPQNLSDNYRKRLFLYPWMMLVAQIGDGRLHQIMPVNRPEILFQAQSSGKVSFFVNQKLDTKGMQPPTDMKLENITTYYGQLDGELEMVLHPLD